MPNDDIRIATKENSLILNYKRNASDANQKTKVLKYRNKIHYNNPTSFSCKAFLQYHAKLITKSIKFTSHITRKNVINSLD